MKKHIASLAVILLAVSSLTFYGCGGAEEIIEDDNEEDPADPLVNGEEGGLVEEGEEGEEEGSNP